MARNNKKVVILRGLPSAGKTTRARELVRDAPVKDAAVPSPADKWAQEKANINAALYGRTTKDAVVVSADDFFVDPDGNYNFDPSKLGQAHSFCMHRFLNALGGCYQLVVVDNTNSQKWEYTNYVTAAQLAGYEVEIETVCGGTRVQNITADEINKLAARNTHGVPALTIAAMALRWEDE